MTQVAKRWSAYDEEAKVYEVVKVASGLSKKRKGGLFGRAKSEEGPDSHGAFLSRLREYVRRRDEERIHGEIAAYYKEWSEVGQQRKTAAHYHLEQLTQVGAWGRVERR